MNNDEKYEYICLGALDVGNFVKYRGKYYEVIDHPGDNGVITIERESRGRRSQTIFTRHVQNLSPICKKCISRSGEMSYFEICKYYPEEYLRRIYKIKKTKELI